MILFEFSKYINTSPKRRNNQSNSNEKKHHFKALRFNASHTDYLAAILRIRRLIFGSDKAQSRGWLGD